MPWLHHRIDSIAEAEARINGRAGFIVWASSASDYVASSCQPDATDKYRHVDVKSEGNRLVVGDEYFYSTITDVIEVWHAGLPYRLLQTLPWVHM